MIKKILNVNGVERTAIADADATLADVLRENLFLTGTKVGCGKGECGACSVIMNGKVVRSCITRIKQVPDNAAITTIEGVGTPQNLHALQLAWIAHNGAQCGFCTPGFIVSAKALLDENQKPTREEVRDWFQRHHNACRCTGYKPLVDAVMDAARVVRGELKAENLAFKIPADGRIWGTKHPRPTAVARVTGTLDYGADLGLKLPKDALHLALTQAEVSHAEILSIDTSEAEKMPGVFKVLTHKDVKGTQPDDRAGQQPTQQEQRIGPSHPVRRQGLPVRRRHSHRLRRHRGARTGRGGEGEGRAERAARVHERPGGHGPRRPGDPSGHAERLFHDEE